MKKKNEETFSSKQFRKELENVLPGYKWTVHRKRFGSELRATGIQSSGFNRLSTIQVTKGVTRGEVGYYVRSSGFGTKLDWLAHFTAPTLKQALRGLQTHYESMASMYSGHAGAIQSARKLG